MSLYFRQLLAGRDFGRTTPGCRQMENFIYLVGDTETRECVVVDPAWAVNDLLDVAAADDMRIVGMLATHYHPDHVGGSMFGFTLEGASTLMARNPCRLHCHAKEAEGMRRVTGLSASDLETHEDGDVVRVGNVEIRWVHTPGHTPGSSCFRVGDALVAGDTLFLQGCGRVDLPGGDPEEMYRTLHGRLAALPDTLELYPGHAYGGHHAPLSQVRQTNPYLTAASRDAWMRQRGV